MGTYDKPETDKNKKILIEQFEKIPIVQIACEKNGIARSSFYRWREKDKKFAKRAEEALIKGRQLINDLAESQLISAIKDKNMTAIIFWLKNNHKAYKNKMEVSGKIETKIGTLSPQQEGLILKALEFSSLAEKDNSTDDNLLDNKEKHDNR